MAGSIQKKVFLTGVAGFIGFHFARRLLNENFQVYGIDNINDYYPRELKLQRLEILKKQASFQFNQLDLNDPELTSVLQAFNPDYVVHLAAQPGVRYSLTHPEPYIQSNINGFVQLFEALKKIQFDRHVIYASSSSVYGMNTKVPFSTTDAVDHPTSLYAATKRSNELMAHVYSHLYGIPVTGLRFFTVYGSWGRPDMAYYSFTNKIVKGQTIDIFNHGKMRRDFTHVFDIVESMFRLLDRTPKADPLTGAKSRILNIGASSPVDLMEFVHILERHLGKKAKVRLLPMQPGDVPATYADVSELENEVQYTPQVMLEEGLKEFVGWYLEYCLATSGILGGPTSDLSLD